ncbi:hypothetical protein SKAU_G00351500 [Synaphobranchus kaupii]|uniref:Uncharacterized protein n=1 Tax=Synaphobranchus kaupii TaxID=118154 RepID=A0A9Q1IHZ9_SYNKA|nr:hypothetical protein SKAU_G00351500 [Synaphobranchus kaupii]
MEEVRTLEGQGLNSLVFYAFQKKASTSNQFPKQGVNLQGLTLPTACAYCMTLTCPQDGPA